MNKFFLGIDTSNYTTSFAVTDSHGIILADRRVILDVEKGRRGLRQSDALFLHTKNLPLIFSDTEFDFTKINAVGASASPRREEGSYMPVFLGGTSAGRIIAKTLEVPYFEFSHQEGHIKAGLFSSDMAEEDEFYAVHISGGTTEILNVEKKDGRFKTSILGKTLDISAGQLIDRVGVKLGMEFPCGARLEQICAQESERGRLPVSVKGTDINFSGAETRALAIAEDKDSAPYLAYMLCDVIAESLIAALSGVFSKYGEKNVLLVGGVASNSIIKNRLKEVLCKKAYFCLPHFSTDNAVGISLMTGENYD